MQSILFRGKRVDTGGWAFGCLVQKPDQTAYIGSYDEQGSYWDWVLVDSATIGQYTGLDDRNGKRIFEDDVVKYGNTIHRVVFEQRNDAAYFGLLYDELETAPFGYYLNLCQIEVIGNIHDSPELLGTLQAGSNLLGAGAASQPDTGQDPGANQAADPRTLAAKARICAEPQASACGSKGVILGRAETRISFIETSRSSLRAKRLSTQGRLLPHSHL